MTVLFSFTPKGMFINALTTHATYTNSNETKAPLTSQLKSLKKMTQDVQRNTSLYPSGGRNPWNYQIATMDFAVQTDSLIKLVM